MKDRVGVVIAVCVAAGVAVIAFLFLFGGPQATIISPSVSPPTGSTSAATTLPGNPEPASSPSAAASFQAKNPADSPAPIASRAASPVTVVANDADLPPRTVLENIQSAIRLYGTTFGGNPVGNNAEITAALSGNNPKQINFIGNVNGFKTDGQGEMVDNWGTPFFFHQISGSETEIRSAGPDKKMWTADDLIAK